MSILLVLKILILTWYPLKKCSNFTTGIVQMQSTLTLFRTGLSRTAYGWWSDKKAPLPKICHTYPAMMKLGTVTP